MEPLILIITILAIHIFAWFTPGPLFVLIVRNSLVYSRKSGIWTAVGIAIGNLVHITYSVTGIALIISASPIAFNIIKFLGVGYLAYLGVKTFIINVESQTSQKPKTASKTISDKRKALSSFQAAKTGFLANILSPKASLFFASIFAAVFSSGAQTWVVVFLMIVMPINSFVMASVLSVFFTHKKVISVYSKHQSIVNKCLGISLILLAVIIAFHK